MTDKRKTNKWDRLKVENERLNKRVTALTSELKMAKELIDAQQAEAMDLALGNRTPTLLKVDTSDPVFTPLPYAVSYDFAMEMPLPLDPDEPLLNLLPDDPEVSDADQVLSLDLDTEMQLLPSEEDS